MLCTVDCTKSISIGSSFLLCCLFLLINFGQSLFRCLMFQSTNTLDTEFHFQNFTYQQFIDRNPAFGGLSSISSNAEEEEYISFTGFGATYPVESYFLHLVSPTPIHPGIIGAMFREMFAYQ
eukprot:NODE_189_length_13483_cov_0.581067.p10 type:complete len:122 gc:universal NODE_189_length_13483_cov_0.581067:2355-1990(-)